MRRIRIFPAAVFLGGMLWAGVTQGQTPAAEGVEVALPLRPPGNLSLVRFVETETPLTARRKPERPPTLLARLAAKRGLRSRARPRIR